MLLSCFLGKSFEMEMEEELNRSPYYLGITATLIFHHSLTSTLSDLHLQVTQRSTFFFYSFPWPCSFSVACRLPSCNQMVYITAGSHVAGSQSAVPHQWASPHLSRLRGFKDIRSYFIICVPVYGNCSICNLAPGILAVLFPFQSSFIYLNRHQQVEWLPYSLVQRHYDIISPQWSHFQGCVIKCLQLILKPYHTSKSQAIAEHQLIVFLDLTLSFRRSI